MCFVFKDEVYCVPADGSAKPRQLTTGARGCGKTHGLADFLAQEELDRRGRGMGKPPSEPNRRNGG